MNLEVTNSDTQQLEKFLVVGFITSEDFQKSRYAVLKLYKSFPKEFDSPDIRPMLDVEWNEFITKYRRRLGNGLWSIQNRVIIFKNGEFLGDFSDLYEFIWKRWKYVFNQDWHDLATRHLIEYLEEKTSQYRQLVYFTIAINSQVIGSLLFELYNDVVPLACENFSKHCTYESGGYAGAPIHRIVKNSWIQCGGYELDPVQIPCENYVVPHDRRGVLSMCNNGPHRDNSTQFYISLESAPWMNYKYVAFGQLLQGDDVLKTIEDVPTYYQAPSYDISIVKCGEFKTRFQADHSNVLFTADEIQQWQEIQRQIDILTYLKSFHQVIGGEAHQGPPTSFGPAQYAKYNQSLDSILSQSEIKRGTYSLRSDLKSYSPFSHLPVTDDDNDEGDEDYDTCGPSYPLMKYKKELYDDRLTPASSDMTL